MILSIRLKVPEEDVRRCISFAHKARFGDPLPVDKIKPFEIGDKMNPSDIENIFIGVCQVLFLILKTFPYTSNQ